MPNTDDHPTATDRRLLLLSPADNVLTIIATLEPGETIRIAGQSVVVSTRLPLGHNLAARELAPGEKIIKYGVPIGSAVTRIATGEHVHTHNLQSDYLPTFLRENQRAFYAANHEHA